MSLVAGNKKIAISGIGLHSGNEVTLNLTSALKHMTFRNSNFINKIRVSPSRVVETTLSTVVGVELSTVSTIEHLMAALWAYNISRFHCEVSDSEIPILDGSSKTWVDLLGRPNSIKLRATPASPIIIDQDIEVTEGNSYIKISPADSFYADVTIDFPYPSIGVQRYTSILTPEIFKKELAFCRTFVHIKEVEYLRSIGKALGGSLDNAIVVDNTKVINPGGLRTHNEMVKHKVLDMIGDLWTLGRPIQGKITAYKPGHKINNLLARRIAELYNL